jgi:predicted dehydrogenase
MGILGTAKIARSVIPHLIRSSIAEVVAVGSRSLDQAQRFAAEFGIPRAFGNYEDVLALTELDAVYIPLPPSMHSEWTMRAARSGKHVLCEKPLGVSADDVQKMIDVCCEQGVVLLDGVMWYHTERARLMKRLAGDGSLGELRQITSAFTFPGDVLASDNLRFSSAMGGGSLLDIGWYCVGVSLWMLDAMPEKVFAAAQWRDGVDIHLNGLMWFPQNQVASLECGFNAIRRRWVEVAGTRAAIVCDDFTRPWNPEKPRFWIHDADGVSHQQISLDPPIEQCLIEAFCDLVRRKNIRHDWLSLSLRTQQVCDALLKSARSGLVECVGL